jgi:hypothetical protein
VKRVFDLACSNRCALQLHKELIRRGDVMDASNKKRILETKRLSELVASLEFSQEQHLELIANQVRQRQGQFECPRVALQHSGTNMHK